MTNDTKDLTHEERKRKTWPNQDTLVNSGAAMFLPMMAMLMSESNAFGEPIVAKERSRELKKCALPSCDVMFLPERDSQCCCTKEHFLELRKLQKERT